MNKDLPLSGQLFQLDNAYKKGGLESIFIGMINDNAYQINLNIIDSLQNQLPNSGSILTRGSLLRDLVSLNIQRGREHGLPSYLKYRQLCGLSPVGDFGDLFKFDFANMNLLSKVYE